MVPTSDDDRSQINTGDGLVTKRVNFDLDIPCLVIISDGPNNIVIGNTKFIPSIETGTDEYTVYGSGP